MFHVLKSIKCVGKAPCSFEQLSFCLLLLLYLSISLSLSLSLYVVRDKRGAKNTHLASMLLLEKQKKGAYQTSVRHCAECRVFIMYMWLCEYNTRELSQPQESLYYRLCRFCGLCWLCRCCRLWKNV